jgi:hypothetical protein
MPTGLVTSTPTIGPKNLVSCKSCRPRDHEKKHVYEATRVAETSITISPHHLKTTDPPLTLFCFGGPPKLKCRTHFSYRRFGGYIMMTFQFLPKFRYKTDQNVLNKRQFALISLLGRQNNHIVLPVSSMCSRID